MKREKYPIPRLFFSSCLNALHYCGPCPLSVLVRSGRVPYSKILLFSQAIRCREQSVKSFMLHLFLTRKIKNILIVPVFQLGKRSPFPQPPVKHPNALSSRTRLRHNVNLLELCLPPVPVLAPDAVDLFGEHNGLLLGLLNTGRRPLFLGLNLIDIQQCRMDEW